MTSSSILALAATSVAFAIMPCRLLAQRITVSGVVADESQQRPIAGATIRLDSASVSTDSLGRFLASVASAGHYTATISAVGYQVRSFGIWLSADTVLRVAMQRQAVSLAPVIVRGGNVTIRGRVRDASTGEFLLQGQVTLYPGGRTIGTTSGDFTFDDAPRGELVTLVFEALEHLPKQISLVTTRDTSLNVALDVDSVGLRLVAAHVRRLASRSNAVAFSLDALDRDAIRRSKEPSIGELIRHRLPPGSIKDRWPYKESCVFFDDQPVAYDVVMNLPREAIERVEIYGFRGRMIRVYSKRYVASLMRERFLPPVVC